MRRAIVSYDTDASPETKSRELRMGLEDVIAELIIDHDEDADDVRDLCENAIDAALSDKGGAA